MYAINARACYNGIVMQARLESYKGQSKVDILYQPWVRACDGLSNTKALHNRAILKNKGICSIH